MSIANASANPYFRRPDLSGSVPSVALLAAAAGMTAMLWLSAVGVGNQPRGYMAALAEASPARVTLPRVEVVARRDSVASMGEAAAGCLVEPGIHKPG